VVIRYVPRHSRAEAIRKIVRLKTNRLPLPALKQVLTGVRIISTVWKPVENAETAIKEANANRLARAKFEQALSSDDPVVVSSMLDNLEDDGTAGAVLLMTALPLLLAKKQHKSLHSVRGWKSAAARRDDKEYCKIADELGLKNRGKNHMAAQVRKVWLKTRGKAPHVRTIVRAFDKLKYR